jgi:hypothetical protein
MIKFMGFCSDKTNLITTKIPWFLIVDIPGLSYSRACTRGKWDILRDYLEEKGIPFLVLCKLM